MNFICFLTGYEIALSSAGEKTTGFCAFSMNSMMIDDVTYLKNNIPDYKSDKSA